MDFAHLAILLNVFRATYEVAPDPGIDESGSSTGAKGIQRETKKATYCGITDFGVVMRAHGVAAKWRQVSTF